MLGMRVIWSQLFKLNHVCLGEDFFRLCYISFFVHYSHVRLCVRDERVPIAVHGNIHLLILTVMKGCLFVIPRVRGHGVLVLRVKIKLRELSRTTILSVFPNGAILSVFFR